MGATFIATSGHTAVTYFAQRSLFTFLLSLTSSCVKFDHGIGLFRQFLKSMSCSAPRRVSILHILSQTEWLNDYILFNIWTFEHFEHILNIWTYWTYFEHIFWTYFLNIFWTHIEHLNIFEHLNILFIIWTICWTFCSTFWFNIWPFSTIYICP